MKHQHENAIAALVDVDTTRQLLRPSLKDVHFPDCTCFACPIYDVLLRELVSNGNPIDIYRYCRCCGNRARSPVKRETISLHKWRELLIESGREVC